MVYKFASHREDEGPSGESILFECCSQRAYGRPQVASQQKLNAADQGECLPCPESWP